jgi:molecular chaperone GrpE
MDTAVDGIQQGLAELEKHLARMDREQFKARALAEAQMEQVTAALELLRASDARREAELNTLRTRSQAEQTAARLEVAQAMLPALDGLDEALRSGQHLLEQHTEAPRPSTLVGRLRARLIPRRRVDPGLREAMEAWLVGLTFVRQRLLDVLAVEGVQPIAAQGQPFDPHYHVALEVIPAGDTLSPGTVSAELRRGYLMGDRVLRYAEVAVAGEDRS